MERASTDANLGTENSILLSALTARRAGTVMIANSSVTSIVGQTKGRHRATKPQGAVPQTAKLATGVTCVTWRVTEDVRTTTVAETEDSARANRDGKTLTVMCATGPTMV